MTRYSTPGVYKEDIFPLPGEEFATGVPVFLGYVHTIPSDTGGEKIQPMLINLWTEFEDNFMPSHEGGYLSSAVHGFFENGGAQCYVYPLDREPSAINSLEKALEEIESLDSIDLVCAPDAVISEEAEAIEIQRRILEHCNRSGDRFAILDSLPGSDRDKVLNQSRELTSDRVPVNGALYYPFVKDMYSPGRFVPPCGHVAGVYSRVDGKIGVHKAPANEVVEGVLDLETVITNDLQDSLNPKHINCLRAFSGRGIRVWGVRTLSKQPDWIYINVRRLFLTIGRWIERNMVGVVFNSNDPKLWVRINRELTTYLAELFMKGALKGRSTREAFYIKCDDETNPPEVRDSGTVVTEIGLAPSTPKEFIVVRIIHGASGVMITGPSGT